MEHLRLSISVFCLLAVCVCLSACKQPIAEPELIDPIYADLTSEFRNANSAYEAEKKAIEEAALKYKKTDAKDPFRKRALRELRMKERGLVDLRQKRDYFEVRLEQRKEYARRDYLKAFHADQKWPRPEEIAEYKTLKKLRGSSRNWDDRVPKLTRHLKQQPVEGKDAKKPASEGAETKAAH